MKKHLVVVSALLAACVLSLAACSKSTQQTGGGGESAPADQTVLYGKVTAVDGEKITLALGTMPEGDRGGGNRGNAEGGETASGGRGGDRKPESGLRERSGGESGQSRAFRGPTGSGGGNFADFSGMLTLTGETKTITITDESVLQGMEFRGKPSGSRPEGSSQNASGGGVSESGKQVSLSDIKVGSVLRATYRTSDQALISVSILGGGDSSSESSK